jgi:phosphoserine aminotransferase
MLPFSFEVGPSKLYNGVADFISHALIQEGWGEVSHRSARFTEGSKNTQEKFRSFFRVPEDYHIFYTYSATEGMEIFSRSVVDQDCYHIVNGTFGNKWHKTALRAGKKALKINDPQGYISLDQIDPPPQTEMVAITANETATGLAYTPSELEAVRQKSGNALFIVDITSGVGAVEYDFSIADGWFFSVQKAFGLPAGLGVAIVGPRIMEKAAQRADKNQDVGCHHTLAELQKIMEKSFQTPTTPNVLNILALGFVVEQLEKDFGSLSHLYQKTQEKIRYLTQAVESIEGLRVVSNSESICVIESSESQIKNLKEKISAAGMSVGSGYGERKIDQIRIANFPVHTMEDLQKLVKVMQG